MVTNICYNNSYELGGFMDCIYYKCSTCGFVHQVPSYWSGHSPEDSIEMQHVDLKTKEMCEDITLRLIVE
jgi:hypothetical protein